MAEGNTPWSLSWFRAQGFDCDLDASFDFLEDKLQHTDITSQVELPSVPKSSSQPDLQLESLEPSARVHSSPTSDSDEAQLEFISRTLSQLAADVKHTIDSSHLSERVSDTSVSSTVAEASRLLQSIDHNIALASSAPPIPESEAPLPASYHPIPKPTNLIDTRSAIQTLPMKRVNLIAGELRLLQYKISVAEADLIRARKALLTIPDTNECRRQYLFEQYVAISAQLKAFREQWRLIAKEQTTQLNELRHNIVYYNIYADSGHRLPHLDSQVE